MQTGNSKKSHRYVNEEEGKEDKEEDTIPRITQDMGRFGAHPTSILSGNLPVFSILQIIFLYNHVRLLSFCLCSKVLSFIRYQKLCQTDAALDNSYVESPLC